MWWNLAIKKRVAWGFRYPGVATRNKVGEKNDYHQLRTGLGLAQKWRRCSQPVGCCEKPATREGSLKPAVALGPRLASRLENLIGKLPYAVNYSLRT
jgi:hypothetical protein